MCGIAGIVQEESQEHAPTNWPEVLEQLARLSSLTIDVSQPEGLEAQLNRAETLTLPLREYPCLRSLIENPPVQAQLLELGHKLVGFDQELLALVNSPDSALSIEAIERWNSLSIRIRDLAWLVEKDVLDYLPRVKSLIVEEHRSKPAAWFQAWKLAVTLENIGRMEVRGRDSLGISLMVNFPDNASYAAWNQSAQQSHPGEIEQRTDAENFTNFAIIKDTDNETPGLVFVYKVAQEVGALGDNVAFIYKSIASDHLVWSALMTANVKTNLFSNGIISEPNCHPISELTLKQNGKTSGAPSPHRIMVCLNGDVDNYQELCARITSETGRTIPAKITTDTKIIPVLVDYYFQQSQDMREAFCNTVSDCEGSIAIIMQNTHEPNRTYLALRGSGQALFVGLCDQGYVFASELYGVVEQTQRIFRMDGTTER